MSILARSSSKLYFVGGRRWYRISTLNKTRLSPSDCLPFKAINDASLADSSNVTFLPPARMQYVPDPSPSGFLYLHRQEGAPSVLQELRFRVVDQSQDKDDVESLFQNGSDFVLRNNVLYSLPLYKIIKTPSLAPIKDLLLKDGCITEELAERIQRIFPDVFPDSPPLIEGGEEGKRKLRTPLSPSTVVYELGQPFPLKVYHNKATLFLVSEDQVVDLNIGMAWLGYPSKRQRVYKGTALATIERAPSPSTKPPSDPKNEEGFFSPSPPPESPSQITQPSNLPFSPSPYLPLSPSSSAKSHNIPNALPGYILRLVRPPRLAVKERKKERKSLPQEESELREQEMEVTSEVDLEVGVGPNSSTMDVEALKSEPGGPSPVSETEAVPLSQNQKQLDRSSYYKPYLQSGHSVPLRAFSYKVTDQRELVRVIGKVLG